VDLIKANKAIKVAGGAAVFIGGLTLIVSVIAGLGYSFAGITVWSLFDAVFILGMAYGIYKKSRACAVIMFVYWAGSKIYSFAVEGQTGGIPIALLFAYFFLQGIIGTFAYRQITDAKTKAEQKDEQSRQPSMSVQEQPSQEQSVQEHSYASWRGL
jgi:serine/threonine-protein kinase